MPHVDCVPKREEKETPAAVGLASKQCRWELRAASVHAQGAAARWNAVTDEGGELQTEHQAPMQHAPGSGGSKRTVLRCRQPNGSVQTSACACRGASCRG